MNDHTICKYCDSLITFNFNEVYIYLVKDEDDIKAYYDCIIVCYDCAVKFKKEYKVEHINYYVAKPKFYEDYFWDNLDETKDRLRDIKSKSWLISSQTKNKLDSFINNIDNLWEDIKKDLKEYEKEEEE